MTVKWMGQRQRRRTRVVHLAVVVVVVVVGLVVLVPVLQGHDREGQRQSLNVQDPDLGIERRLAGIRIEPPGIKIEVPGIRIEAPGIRIEVPVTRIEVPGNPQESEDDIIRLRLHLAAAGALVDTDTEIDGHMIDVVGRGQGRDAIPQCSVIMYTKVFCHKLFFFSLSKVSLQTLPRNLHACEP